MDQAEYIERMQRVISEDKTKQQEFYEKCKQEAIKRREEGKPHPCDYVYFQKETSKDKIAHQDEQIAHPDAMRKAPATILLVIGLIGSLIFKQWYLVWALLLLWYFSKSRV